MKIARHVLIWASFFSLSGFEAFAQFPAAPSDELTSSLGKFTLSVQPAFRNLFIANEPELSANGYVLGPFGATLTSPTLYDPMTVIGISGALMDGSVQDTSGVAVGTAGTIVSDADLQLPKPAGFENGLEEVHLEIRSLNMVTSVNDEGCPLLPGFLPTHVRAGTAAPAQPISPGEVSQNAAGSHFPADSRFEVFVEIDIPGPVLSATIANPSPMLVEAAGITDLPPEVVYIHGGSSQAPVHFKGGPFAGQLLGGLQLAGHDIGPEPRQCTSDPNGFQDRLDRFEALFEELTPIPSPPRPAFHLDFDSDPTPGLVVVGDSKWVNTGGLNDTGYLSITDAANGQRGTVIFPNINQGEDITEFKLKADLRIGGGTESPADGLSFNLARPADPVLQDFAGIGYAGSPDGAEQDLPEEGTQTGLAIGFDEWDSGAPDVVGLSIRLDGELIEQIEMPVPNGDLFDPGSLQTGEAGLDARELGWAPFELNMTNDQNLTISWKGEEVFNNNVPWEPGPGQLVIGGRTGGANSNHHIDNLWFMTNPTNNCDFDGDGVLGILDLDLLRAEVKAGTNNATFDINGDNVVDFEDLKEMVTGEEKLHTWFGDANLDGEFNSADLVVVFTAGEFEDGPNMNSTWATGDWNGNGDFDSSDLVTAFQAGGFEQGPLWQTQAVPEPSSLVLLGVGCLAFIHCRIRQRRS